MRKTRDCPLFYYLDHRVRNNIVINATRKPFHTKTITLRCGKRPQIISYFHVSKMLILNTTEQDYTKLKIKTMIN